MRSRVPHGGAGSAARCSRRPAAEARRLGCRELAGHHATPAGAAFAAAAGASDTRTDVRSLLDLPGAALDAPAVDGYRLLSWIGAAPERLLAGYAVARNAINDAPASNELEQHVWTEETVRDEEAMLEQRGRQLRITVALDPGENVAAFTELRISPEPGAVASTEDTATVAAHRGRGLAGWVKAESLRRLRADRPDVRLVTTTNAAGNEPILALNRRLGFERVAVATTASVALEGASVQ